MPSERETLDAIRQAIVAHVDAHHNRANGDVVTDFVVILGYVNITGDDEGNGVHIVTSDGTPNYTSRGLIETASSIYAAGPNFRPTSED